MVILEKHIVDSVTKDERVSDYLVNKFEIICTRKGIKKAIKSKRILQNSKPALSGNYVKKNDIFELIERIDKPPKIFPLKLDIVYEDDFLAIIEKPAGIAVSGNKYKTITNALAHNLKRSSQKDVLPYFQPIHRLDVATSGVLIVAKTYASRIALGKMLENRTISKTYLAVVQNKLEGKGLLNTSIDGKQCLSSYKSLLTQTSKKNGYLSVVELSPITGRTHQLRIHLSRLGFPIVGDKLYGDSNNLLKHKGLFLAAVSLSFEHPILNKKVVAKIEQPLKFNALLKREFISLT